MNISLNSGTYVMNCKTGKAYKIATNTIQTRNRRQLTGMEIRHPKVTRASIYSLRKLSESEGKLCYEAERIMRGKHKRTDNDRAILLAWRELRKKIVK